MIFFTSETYTGGKIYKCRKCGLTINSPFFSNDIFKNYFGSYIDKSSNKWIRENMHANHILSFHISYGDFPILNIDYRNGTIICKNKINPRDGGLSFPDNFFDETHFSLADNNNKKLLNCLSSIDFSTFTTDTGIYTNYGSPGCCISDIFYCTFTNGRSFECLNPKCDDFKILARLLDEIINDEKHSKCTPFINNDETIWLCKNCGVINKMKYDICYNCGSLRNC